MKTLPEIDGLRRLAIDNALDNLRKLNNAGTLRVLIFTALTGHGDDRKVGTGLYTPNIQDRSQALRCILEMVARICDSGGVGTEELCQAYIEHVASREVPEKKETKPS